jgi:hypothetical protein
MFDIEFYPTLAADNPDMPPSFIPLCHSRIVHRSRALK